MNVPSNATSNQNVLTFAFPNPASVLVDHHGGVFLGRKAGDCSMYRRECPEQHERVVGFLALACSSNV